MLPPEFYRRQDFYLRPETRHRKWKLNACPMDGVLAAWKANGSVETKRLD